MGSWEIRRESGWAYCRKAWLFVCSVAGGEQSAKRMTLVSIARRVFPASEHSGKPEEAYQRLARQLHQVAAHDLGLSLDDVQSVWTWLAAARQNAHVGWVSDPTIGKREKDAPRG